MSEITGLTTVLAGLEAYAEGLRQNAQSAAGEIAALLESYAKTHHAWQPQTGATDASTRGFVAEATDDLIVIVLSAGMDYDVFLELARGGKWAWLFPAIVANESRIRQILVRRLGNGRVEAYE